MRIGLTFDLRSAWIAEGYTPEETAEFDSEVTIDALAAAIAAHGHQVDRIGHARQLVARIAAGDRWDLVFNICEGLRGIAREAQVPAILETYSIPYTFADPLVAALTLHKGLTKTVVAAAGIPTTPFAVIASLDQLRELSLPFPLFAKPLAEGTGKGISAASKISDAAALERAVTRLIAEFQQPVLVETFLPGREFTVSLLGTGAATEVLGTIEIILLHGAEAEVYSYINKEQSEQLVECRPVTAADPVVAEAERIAVAAWQTLNCRDSGRVDLRCDAEGRPNFMEVNPLAGLHPTHSDLPITATAVGWTYEKLIGRILESAFERVLPRM